MVFFDTRSTLVRTQEYELRTSIWTSVGMWMDASFGTWMGTVEVEDVQH
jgi:hypothetical protein